MRALSSKFIAVFWTAGEVHHAAAYLLTELHAAWLWFSVCWLRGSDQLANKGVTCALCYFWWELQNTAVTVLRC
jgi:hypothetical protein